VTATYDKIKSQFLVKTFFDDDATAATARKIGWVPMGRNFLAQVAFGAGTGILTFKIFCADASDGTGNVTEVKAHAAPTAADAANDRLTLEVSAEEVRAASPTAKYVSVELDNDANTDENAVVYVVEGSGVGGRFAHDAITPDSEISA
jgi:hypothetical protein